MSLQDLVRQKYEAALQSGDLLYFEGSQVKKESGGMQVHKQDIRRPLEQRVTDVWLLVWDHLRSFISPEATTRKSWRH